MNEAKIATLFRAKGFKYAIQFNTSDGKPFGDPVYFRTLDEIGPYMRSYNLTMVWNKTVDEVIGDD